MELYRDNDTLLDFTQGNEIIKGGGCHDEGFIPKGNRSGGGMV